MMTNLLFVYGTLQRGYGLNRLLQQQGAVFQDGALTVGKYSMLFGGKRNPEMYPVVLGPGQMCGRVAGEVYIVPDGYNWGQLDSIEGAYTRTKVRVQLKTTRVIRDGEGPTAVPEVFMYIGKPGRWLTGPHDARDLTRPHTDGVLYWVLP